MTHKLTLISIAQLTHDVYRLITSKPIGFSFAPGQATQLTLTKEGWRDEQRPFTFTSLPHTDALEFIIKSYPEHHGVTKQIPKLEPGDSVMIGDAWGAIEDRGPGTIIAGGAGITPFIAILRAKLYSKGSLEGYHLIFANKCKRDIILLDEFQTMPDLKTTFILSEENTNGIHHGYVDGDFLDRVVQDFSGTFYLCGPPEMEDTVYTVLTERGVNSTNFVKEDA